MKPRKKSPEPNDDMFRSRLENIINMRHELVKLSEQIDWDYIDLEAGQYFSDEGRPANPSRLMVGLLLLKHSYDLSDEALCERWVHDPYFQYFTGEEFFQHQFPTQRSDITHWRQRLGEEFCTKLLQESLRIAHSSGPLRTKDLKRIVVDTTVQPKAVTHPTEAKLRYRAIMKLGDAAKSAGVSLRQSYVRVGKLALIKSGRYRHAKQMKRARREEKRLKTWLGRIIRDVERKCSENELSDSLRTALEKAKQIHQQKVGDQDYLYSWHCPEVECIGVTCKTRNLI